MSRQRCCRAVAMLSACGDLHLSLVAHASCTLHACDAHHAAPKCERGGLLNSLFEHETDSNDTKQSNSNTQQS